MWDIPVQLLGQNMALLSIMQGVVDQPMQPMMVASALEDPN